MTGIIEFKSDTLKVEVSGVDNNLINLIEVTPSKSEVIVNVDNVSSNLYTNNIEVSGASDGTVNIVEITPENQDVYINVQDSQSLILPDLSNFYTKDNPSGFITGLDLSNYATISNLELTGQNLQNQINNIDVSSQLTGISGYFQNQFDNLDLNYATDLQVSQTGSNLQSQINNIYNSGFITGVDLSNYVTSTELSETGLALLNSINQSSGVNGSVYIINISPSGGVGNVGDKIYEDAGGTAANSILNSCSTTTQNVAVSVLALPGHTRYKPIVTINEQIVTLNGLSDRPLFTGVSFINLNGATSLTVNHQDGASHTCQIAQDLPPSINVAYFTGNYPGSQTELKENDTYNFFVQANTPITRIEIDNYGAFKASSVNVTAGTSFTLTARQIANRGTSTQNLGAKVRVQKANGSYSDWYLTENYGNTDGIHLLKLNNTYPTISTISQANITYPSSQSALKDNETAIVNNTVTNADIVTYNSPNGDLSISNSSIYETTKTVQRIGGNYNISSNNFRIVATRTANNATTTNTSAVVYIAHASPTLAVTTPFARLRSGGNDGTSIQSYNIVITANQNLISAPTLIPDANDGGTFSGSGFTGGPTVWTRALQINDNLIKGTKTWGDISATNLAGRIVTTINSGPNYTIGGFISRTLSLAAFANEVTLNTSVSNFSKMTLSWAVKSLPNKATVGTNVPPPLPDTWTIDSLNSNPTIVRILDTSATNSSSAASNVIVEEIV